MYQALYRKWRPKTFSDVVGQEHVTETLQRFSDMLLPDHVGESLGSPLAVQRLIHTTLPLS